MPSLQLVESEQDNFRTALQWCIERADVDRGLALAGAVWRFWYLRSSSSEGREWLDALLQLRSGPCKPANKARALNGAGVLAVRLGDLSTAQELYQESLAIWQRLETRLGLASLSTIWGC